MPNEYTVGEQPCQDYRPSEADSDELCGTGIANVHQCPICWGRRSFCDNCHRDHHEQGWETCKPEAYNVPD